MFHFIDKSSKINATQFIAIRFVINAGVPYSKMRFHTLIFLQQRGSFSKIYVKTQQQ